MAWKLALTNYNNGLESQAAQVLGNLKYFSTLSTPVTITSIRTDYETSQFQPFANDGWDNFIQAVGTIDIDKSVLTVAERAIWNTLQEDINPEPKYGCCDIGGSITPSVSDGFTSIGGFYRTGSTAPYQYEIELRFLTQAYTCDIAYVDVTYTPIGIAPAVTSANPATFYPNGCGAAGLTLNNLWFETATDPAGESYGVAYVYYDKDANVVASYTASYNLNL